MWAAAAGAAIGVAYTLSPLTVVVLIALIPSARLAFDGVPARERRWLYALFGLAIAIRLMAIGGLFVTADPNIPYGFFFGDDEFFKRKSVWLRNVAMGIPISRADFIYAFDDTGMGSYLHFLTYLQALTGLAPYGIHVFNAGVYVISALLLYRLVRASFGGFAAMAGVTVLLFLPSLLTWSVSALKEPLYFLAVALELLALMRVIRAPTWSGRIGAGVAVLAISLALQSLREGGLLLATAGVAGGLTAAGVVNRPRRLIAAALVVPILAGAALSRPAVRQRAWTTLQEAAYKHWGHVNTPGQTYRLMEPQFYVDRTNVRDMTGAQGAQYVARAVWSYLTVPLPWRIESRAVLAFLPEQVVRLTLLAFVPLGIVAGLRRDSLLTCLLVGHGAAAAFMVAVSGGNIGTLVRHRGLAIPYFCWLAGLGMVSAGQSVLLRGAPRRLAPDSKAGLQ
jgi:hypothetical protein